MSPFSLSDDELSHLMTLAACVPVDHRDAFLTAVADALSKYPEDCRGVGLLHREAAKLQRYYVNAPPTMNAVGCRSKYR